MSDIVERLRNPTDIWSWRQTCDIADEAADEIELLRSVLGELLEWFNGCDPRTSARAVEKARRALEPKP